jgi:hypothetical protein
MIRGGIPTGFGCNMADGRTVIAVGAKSVTISGPDCNSQEPAVPAGADGYTYVTFTEGTYKFTSFFCY